MLELKNSVHKTFALLEYFTASKREWGVTELAQEIGSNKSTVFRFLAQMHEIGILDKCEGSEKYRLGLKLFELGNRVELRTALIEKTHPALEAVARNITETVHLAILKNHQVFYVDKVESPQGLKISSDIGSYCPAHATALGKTLLAFLSQESQQRTLGHILDRGMVSSFTDRTMTSMKELIPALGQIRKQHFAIDKQEYEVGLICVAIPVFNQQGEVVASLSASGPANRFQESEVKNYVSTLKEGADAIQDSIGNFKLL